MKKNHDILLFVSSWVEAIAGFYSLVCVVSLISDWKQVTVRQPFALEFFLLTVLVLTATAIRLARKTSKNEAGNGQDRTLDKKGAARKDRESILDS
jgi:hypothetical protein